MATRRAHRSGNRSTTRRRGKSSISVEGLRAAFAKVDSRARDIIARGKTDSELSRAIQAAWEANFHQSLSAPALKGMTMHYRAMYRNRKTRRVQRGGMAPLDYTMGQGITQPVYGMFPTELGVLPRAASALDRFFESSAARACDTTGGEPAPGMQKGGGIIDAVLMGHPPVSVPQNSFASAVGTAQGSMALRDAPAAPTLHTWQMASFTPQPFNSGQLSSIATMSPVYV